MKLIVLLFCCVCSLQPLLGQSVKELLANGKPLTVGLISAVPGETGKLVQLMQGVTSVEKGRRVFYRGKLFGIDTVLVAARIGKVASSATTAQLISQYNVDLVIFTGVAGAVDSSLAIGDIVIASELMQHDVNGEPFCPKYELPLLKIKSIASDPTLELFAYQAAQKFAEKDIQSVIPASIMNEYHISQPQVVKGLVLTGDQVVSREQHKRELKERLLNALCVEMEGASVAQVCYEYDVPFVVVRTISDYANHQEIPVDVRKFVMEVSGYYSEAIVHNMYTSLVSAK
ncbi:MAG: 5'-methylthioadenosine/adenosylhomocysteine nucleosidase [Chlamydiales bacterium]|nr:5'-methylthioadenosine/adenosylhomocysteine nucleosidase [Chlamydiales bacterium]